MTMPGKMTKFRISELSGVTRPAQTGAKAVIMKRADGDPAAIITKADLTAALQAFPQAADKAVAKAHIIARAEALGASDQLPEGWLKKAGSSGEEEGTDAMSNVIKKALGLAESATDAEVEAAISKLATGMTEANAALAKAKTDTDRAIRKASMSSEEVTHCKAMDDDAKDAFMQKPKAERDAAVKKALEGDESLTLHGQTIRKSDVGDGIFAIMKGQAQEIADQKAGFEKAQNDLREATFAKRAKDEFPHLAGSVADRVRVLKALDGADDATKAAAEAIFKAAEATAKLAFDKVGGGGKAGPEGGDSAEAKLNTLAKARQDASGGKLSFAKAYDEVINEQPALYEEALAQK